MLIKFLNVVHCVWNDIVWWNGVELNSYIWDNVWTDACCVLSIDAYVVTEISELHWWSKSHRLRYQVVRSWWRISCTPWHMRCMVWVVLNLPWSFLLDSLVIFGSGVSLWYDLLNTGLPEDVVCWIFWMCRSMWDLCDCFIVEIWRKLNNLRNWSCNLVFSLDLSVYIIKFYFQ